MPLNKSTKEIYNYAQELENRIVFLRGLLKRLIDSGMLTTNEKLMCQEECEDCDLTREILKELGEAQKQANEYIESESAHHKLEDFEDA